MGLFQKINLIWQKVGVVQRALLVAVVLACVITGGLLTKWASTANMELLYGGLPLKDVDQIVNKLREQGVEYKLQGNSNIYVPDSKVLELRASLAGEGLPEGGDKGYKLFDNKSNFGVSPLVQSMNHNRAMQDELAQTIQMFDCIAGVRVHIVRPEETIFTKDSKGATASVSLRLKPGWQVSQATIAAISNLVANATDGLTPDKVTIVDTQGRLLTSSAGLNSSVHGANTFMDYKERVESDIAGKVQDMLDMVLGPGRASVQVSATLDMSSEAIQTTTYEKGMAEEETISTTSTVQEGASAADGTKKTPGSTDKTETIETKSKLPETITTKTDVPGKIVSLAVSAIVDLSVTETPAAGEEGAAAPAAAATPSAKIMTVADVEEIVKNAVGPEYLTGVSALVVKDVPFYRAIIPVDDDSSGYMKLSRYIEIARQSSMGILAVCALLALKIFAGAKKKAGGEGAAVLGGGQVEGMALLPEGHAEMGVQFAYRQQITSAIQKNPEQVKQLFASWLAEDR